MRCFRHYQKQIPNSLHQFRLWDELSVPIFAFVDADPWGYEIMLTYRFGSVAMAWCCESVAVPAIR